MDFQFSKGRKQNRKENRRRSLFRTPTKGGERGAGDESPGQEGGASPQSGTKRDALDAELMDSYEGQQQQQDAKAGRYEAEAVSQQPQQSAAADEGPAMMATGGGGGGGSRAVDMEAEYRPLAKTERNLVDLLADADQPEPLHASIPAELPWSVRLNKLVEMAVENALKEVQTQTRPGEGCVLDAVHRVAQKFIGGLDESVAASGTSQPAEVLSRKLQRQVAALTDTLGQLEQEEASWQRLAAELAETATKRSAAAAAEGGAAAEAAAPPSAELQAQVERLPRAAAAAVDRITLQVDTLRRALQHGQTVYEQAAASQNEAVSRIHAASFPGAPGDKDARPLLRQLLGAGGKENSGS